MKSSNGEGLTLSNNLGENMNNTFKKMEYTLYNFKVIDTKIRNIEIDINRLINDVSLGGGDMFGEKSSPTNAFSSSVENEVIKREENDLDLRLQRLRNRKQYLIDEKEKIENALTHLSDIEYKLVELRYFSRNKLTWVNIGIKLGFDDSYCKKLRNKVIIKLINILEI